MPSGARHPSLRSGRRLMRRPLGQSPRGDTGACYAERSEASPSHFPCHSEVSRAKRRTSFSPCHAERSEASHEVWRRSLAALGMTWGMSCRANARHPLPPLSCQSTFLLVMPRHLPPCHSEVSRAKRRTSFSPCHAERSEASLTTFGTAPHEVWRRSLAALGMTWGMSCRT